MLCSQGFNCIKLICEPLAVKHVFIVYTGYTELVYRDFMRLHLDIDFDDVNGDYNW